MLDGVMANDPQKAWKLIDELKRESMPTDNVEKINHQKWFDHFIMVFLIQKQIILIKHVKLV